MFEDIVLYGVYGIVGLVAFLGLRKLDKKMRGKDDGKQQEQQTE